MKRYTLLYVLSLSLLYGNLFSQNIEINGSYSNISDFDASEGLCDGDILTENNYPSNTWIELYLKDYASIDSIVIYSNEPLDGLYMSVHNQPMYEFDKCEILENDAIISYKLVANKFKTVIRLNGVQRIKFIKLWSENDFSINEIEIYGNRINDILRDRNPHFEGDDIFINGGASCHDGIDNDGDGLTDCEDYPCGVGHMDVFYENPTCPTCDNGKICIKVENAGWLSIDGGQNWIAIPRGTPSWCFENLSAGSYEIVAKSPASCIKEWKENPVVLKGNKVVEDEYCENGGVEYGTFRNWSGGIGNREGVLVPANELPTFNNDMLVNDRQKVIASATFNDQFRNIGLVPKNDDFLIKLGNSQKKDMERLTYSFDITDQNSLFSFWFAVILDDPNDNSHTPEELPFFAYQISIAGKIVFFEKIFSDNPFLIGAGGTKRYFGWTCRKYDLTEFIGKEATIEFVTADCSKGGHFGYAYIDALCHKPADRINYLTISTSDFICNDIFKVKVNGKGYNQYQYSINTYKDNGDLIDSYDLPIEIGYDASKDDFIGYIADKGITLPCPSEVEITLNLFNDCSEFEPLKSRSFYYCPIEKFDPCEDVWVYFPYLIQDFAISGKYDCEGCEYDWQPASYFVDNTVSNPVFRSEDFTNFAEKELTVKIEDKLCPFPTTFTVQLHQQKEVSIIEINPIDNCSGVAEVSLKFKLSTSNYSFDDFYDIITVEHNNTSYNFEMNRSASGVDYIVYTGILPKIPGILNFEYKIRKEFNCDVYAPNPTTLKYDPLSTAPSIFSRIWLAELFNGYRPADGNYFCNIYSPEIDRCWDDEYISHDLKSSVYKIELRIFDKWGNQAYMHLASVPFDSPYGLDGPEAFWDGTYGDGTQAPSGIYMAQFTFYSCSDNSFYQGCYESGNPLNRTSESNVQIETVDVTLIR